MRGPKPPAVNLSDAERTAVKAVVRRHRTPQQVALRGRIILAADAGKNNNQIAREEEVSVDTVRTWRARWLALQGIKLADLSVSERLRDEARPGRPSHITAEQICQMVALACDQPKERPISQWTGREIADEMVRHGIVQQISPRHAARLLKKGISTHT
jgi:transposase